MKVVHQQGIYFVAIQSGGMHFYVAPFEFGMALQTILQDAVCPEFYSLYPNTQRTGSLGSASLGAESER